MAAAALYTQADDAFVSVDCRYAFRREVGFFFFWLMTAQVKQRQSASETGVSMKKRCVWGFTHTGWLKYANFIFLGCKHCN